MKPHTSYAFLMEMICVCALFLVCASIFVAVFAKAETMSRRAELLNQAVLAAENALEISFSEGKLPEETEFTASDLTVSIDSIETDGLMEVTVQVYDAKDGSLIYSLSGARAIPAGGGI